MSLYFLTVLAAPENYFLKIIFRSAQPELLRALVP